jgi:methylenetetrahydrofolate dehydrogenase (NADP+)/methenyltetrahydrofolate cyclohydrolase
LAAVLVGNHPASTFYVKAKRRDCDEVGMNSWLHQLPADTSQAHLLQIIAQLNAEPMVHGILVQLPLPAQIDESAVLYAIDPHKDVDAFHPDNLGRLLAGQPRYVPCTPLGVQQLLVRSGRSWAGQQVVIVGRSNIVGKPLAALLMQKPSGANPDAGDATVTVAHSRTRHLPALTRQADVLVAAIGQPHFITAEHVRPGAVVIDVGINKVPERKQPVGDVDFAAVAPLAAAITPVPGGVGPMTRAMLLLNTLRSAEYHDAR